MLRCEPGGLCSLPETKLDLNPKLGAVAICFKAIPFLRRLAARLGSAEEDLPERWLWTCFVLGLQPERIPCSIKSQLS